MKETLELLWKEYFAEKCATIETDEERALIKKAVERHKEVSEMLSKEENDAVEKYVEVLYEAQASFNKKAFFKGCKFAASFILEMGILEKNKDTSLTER